MAPALSRTKRRPEPAPQEPSMFDVLAQEPRPPQPSQEPEPAPTVDDLMRQMVEMQKQFEARIEQAERANMALTQSVPTPTQVPQQPSFSLDGLPDPLDKPKEYAQEIANRTVRYNQELEAFNRAKNAPAQQQGNPDVLWEDFAEQYGEYAENTDQIAFATQQAVKEAQRRGIDVNRYMYANTDRFFRDIVKHYEKVFGKPGEEGDPEPAPAPTTRRGQEEATRTGGIMGGVDPGPRPRASGQPQTDMLDDLRAWQKKHGYHA